MDGRRQVKEASQKRGQVGEDESSQKAGASETGKDSDRSVKMIGLHGHRNEVEKGEVEDEDE